MMLVRLYANICAVHVLAERSKTKVEMARKLEITEND
jgi:hypothetical protein